MPAKQYVGYTMFMNTDEPIDLDVFMGRKSSLSEEKKKFVFYLLDGSDTDIKLSNVMNCRHIKYEFLGGEHSLDLYELWMHEPKGQNRYICVNSYNVELGLVDSVDEDIHDHLEMMEHWSNAESVHLLRVDDPDGDSCIIAEVISPNSNSYAYKNSSAQ